jgi:hypothetical protein
MAGVVAGTGTGFHRMSPKTQRRSSGMKRDLIRVVNDHHLRRVPARLPSASSLAGRLLLLFAMEFLGVLVLETESLGWQRPEDREFGERLGAPEVLIYGTVAKSFGIHAESYSV